MTMNWPKNPDDCQSWSESKISSFGLGCNSRLDTLQAAILDVKLKHLDEYGAARYEAAQYYTRRLSGIEGIITPAEMPYSTHVYHQYTLKVLNGRRDVLEKISGGGRYSCDDLLSIAFATAGSI
jgi:Predicted pyridoxal phosphate-dependent enzyme apparently involved in regulation of cell wall biogenesis